jgi:hypothetical protein
MEHGRSKVKSVAKATVKQSRKNVKKLNHHHLWAGVACAGFFALIAVPKSQAQFTTILNNSVPVLTSQVTTATDPELVGASVLATTGNQSYTTLEGASGIGGFYDETVYKQTNGLLDFVIQVSNLNATAEGVLHLTLSNFAVAGVTNAVAFENITGLEPLGIAGTVGSTSAQETGGVINFLLAGSGATAGLTSDSFIVQTNATAFVPGILSIQDGATSSDPGFAPAFTAAIPELSNLFCGLAVLGLAAFQVAKMLRRNDANGMLAA